MSGKMKLTASSPVKPPRERSWTGSTEAFSFSGRTNPLQLGKRVRTAQGRLIGDQLHRAGDVTGRPTEPQPVDAVIRR